MKTSNDLAEGNAMSGILEAVSFRKFLSEDEVKGFAARRTNEMANSLYHPPSGPDVGEDPSALMALLIFSTSKQQTWLVADSLNISCVLDDRRKEEPTLRWFLSKKEAIPVVARDYSTDSGLLDIGPRREWLYSKRLFHSVDIVTAVQRLIDGAPR
jgi:hypothetical protein